MKNNYNNCNYYKPSTFKALRRLKTKDMFCRKSQMLLALPATLSGSIRRYPPAAPVAVPPVTAGPPGLSSSVLTMTGP